MELTITINGPSGPPTGSVTVLDRVTPICASAPLVTVRVSAIASCSTSSLSLGAHSITANYPGDSTYVSAVSDPPYSQEVAQASTTTTVESDSPTSTFGDTVRLTATVEPVAPGAGTPSGTVDFRLGGVHIAPCEATGLIDGTNYCETNAMPVGHTEVTVEYSGDSSYVASTSAAIDQNVNPATTTTDLTASIDPSRFGQAVQLDATVTCRRPAPRRVPSTSTSCTATQLARSSRPSH